MLLFIIPYHCHLHAFANFPFIRPPLEWLYHQRFHHNVTIILRMRKYHEARHWNLHPSPFATRVQPKIMSRPSAIEIEPRTKWLSMFSIHSCELTKWVLFSRQSHINHTTTKPISFPWKLQLNARIIHAYIQIHRLTRRTSFTDIVVASQS